MSRSIRVVAWVCAGAALVVAAEGAPPGEQAIRHHLRVRLEHQSSERALRIGDEPIYSSRALPSFYEARLYRPAWMVDLEPAPAARELVQVIERAAAEGLDPTDYHRDAIARALAAPPAQRDPTELAVLDILLTDSFLMLGAHLVSGRVDPETFDGEWIAYRREVDLLAALERAAVEGPERVLMQLLPRHAGYAALRQALGRYRALAERGGWGRVEAGATLLPGGAEARVVQLRRRFDAVVRTAVAPVGHPERYDEELAAEVRRFQERHGLEPDGIVGAKTLAALNVSTAERVRQIELNLERWRWLPQDLGERHVIVNIPAFAVSVIERDAPVLEMRAAVGRPYRRTPVFSDTIRYLVLNPYWEVPHKIAVQDKLPEVQKDPEYLAKQGFRVYTGWGGEQVEIDPAGVDWGELRRDRFPYRLRQEPGPLNALGRVKFMFPNRFNVYLHDTPSREVFRQAERDVSSGCIRLEAPLELAELLLGAPSSGEALSEALATGRESVLPLPRPTPVHLLYWTAWAEADGSVQFRRDIYERDALLTEALARAEAEAKGRSAGA